MLVQSKESVQSYDEEFAWRPLANVPTPGPYSKHTLVQHTVVQGLKGDPGWVALGDMSSGGQEVLLIIEGKSRYTLPVPQDTTTAAMYQDADTRQKVLQPLQQVYGYMTGNNVSYAVLTSGELFCFLHWTGSTLRLADVRGTAQELPTALASLYYILHLSSSAPGQLVEPRKPSAAPPAAGYIAAVRGLAAALGRMWRAAEWLLGIVMMALASAPAFVRLISKPL